MKKTSALLLCLLTLSSSCTFGQLQQAFVTSAGSAQLANDVGAAYVNIASYNWRRFQQYPTSEYNWSSLDADVQEFQSKGIGIYFTIQCVSPIGIQRTPCAISYSNSKGIFQSWFPEDTVQWKTFLDALVQRYDKDGLNDMPGLLRPVTHWHIEQEWARIWCSQYSDTSIAFAQEFVRYVNMTYAAIKSRQPGASISFAGIDTRHDLIAFYDGYSDLLAICLSPACGAQSSVSRAQLGSNPEFLANRRNALYILRNARCDEVDIHQYGRWQEIPYVVRWLKDSAALGSRPVVFLEGGGPFCKACEFVYHTPSDTSGYLPPELVRDNASFVTYYFITGLANGVKRLHWHIAPEYSDWGSTFGDLDLLSKDFKRKPSYYTYRYLANLLRDTAADTIIRVSTSSPFLYYYQIQPLGVSVLWSTKSRDTVRLAAPGPIFISQIPTMMGDSLVRVDTLHAQGSASIVLSDGVPLFVSGASGVAAVGQESAENIPRQFELFQNHPNPFNPSTEIRFQLPKATRVTLKVFNMLGEEVATLVNDARSPGLQVITWDASGMPSGVYFYCLQAGENIAAKRMILLK